MGREVGSLVGRGEERRIGIEVGIEGRGLRFGLGGFGVGCEGREAGKDGEVGMEGEQRSGSGSQDGRQDRGDGEV